MRPTLSNIPSPGNFIAGLINGMADWFCQSGVPLFNCASTDIAVVGQISLLTAMLVPLTTHEIVMQEKLRPVRIETCRSYTLSPLSLELPWQKICHESLDFMMRLLKRIKSCHVTWQFSSQKSYKHRYE